MPISKPVLDALLSAIREEGSYVLASFEDAEYFRKHFRKAEATASKWEPVPSPPQPMPLEPVRPEPVRPKPAKQEQIPAKTERTQPKLQSPLEMPKQADVTLNFSSVHHLLASVAPELAILDAIPSDEIAQKLSNRWKTKSQSAPISILVYQEPLEQRVLLEEIATALDVYFGPAKIVHAEGIEKEKQWETFLSVKDLKMVIACDYTLWQLSNLMKFYKETPAQGTRLLGMTPLFLLPDLSLYLKDALLKRSLWKAICQKCT